MLCVLLKNEGVVYKALRVTRGKPNNNWNSLKMACNFWQGDFPKFDLEVDQGTDFSTYKAQWEAYMSLSVLDREPQTKQVQVHTLCLSCETLTICNNLGLMKTKYGKVETIVEAMQWYIEGQINESVDCRNFQWHVQQPSEMFDASSFPYVN